MKPFLAFNWKKSLLNSPDFVSKYPLNKQPVVSERFGTLNVTDASLHFEASKVCFELLKSGNRKMTFIIT